MSENYKVVDGHGDLVAAGLQEAGARMVAQQIAAKYGEPLWLFSDAHEEGCPWAEPIPLEDAECICVGEKFEPSRAADAQ